MKIKKIICAAALVLALCASPAGAFETPLQDEEGIAVVKKLGVFFTPVAEQFGCSEFAWANVTSGGKLASLEFVPPGDKVAEWKRMVTITVYSLSPDKAQSKVEMYYTLDALTKQFETNGKLLSKSLYKNKSDEGSSYFEYETGLGASKEHNAGVYMRVTPALAAFMQLQTRGGAVLSEADRVKVHQMVNPRAGQDKKQ